MVYFLIQVPCIDYVKSKPGLFVEGIKRGLRVDDVSISIGRGVLGGMMYLSHFDFIVT